jgi:hypothetical protein
LQTDTRTGARGSRLREASPGKHSGLLLTAQRCKKELKNKKACARRRAIVSVQANPACPDKAAAERAVNEVWESCFNDTRPFDEVRHVHQALRSAKRNSVLIREQKKKISTDILDVLCLFRAVESIDITLTTAAMRTWKASVRGVNLLLCVWLAGYAK